MTKQEILRHSVGLISVYPLEGSLARGQTTFTSSAEHYYDLAVPPAMENFVYGFGVHVISLQNPTEDPNDSNFLVFDLPKDTGFIFYVGEPRHLPELQAIIGLRGLRNWGSVPWTSLTNFRLRVHFRGSYNNEFVIGYISTQPDPEHMSANFTNFVIHNIAAQLARKNIQQKIVYQDHFHQALMFKAKAQKFSLDNASSFSYSQPSLATAPLTTNSKGQSLPTDSDVFKIYKFIRDD